MAGKSTQSVVGALAAPKPSRVGVKVRESFVWDRELEQGPKNLLWLAVNLFHRAIGRTLRELDDNRGADVRPAEQDSPEIRSVALERLTSKGMMLIECRDTIKIFRD